jgi:hypothetical protein
LAKIEQFGVLKLGCWIVGYLDSST